MLQISTTIFVWIYAAGLIVFLSNCSIELMNKGQKVGANVLIVSLLWPFVLIAALVGEMARAAPTAPGAQAEGTPTAKGQLSA